MDILSSINEISKNNDRSGVYTLKPDLGKEFNKNSPIILFVSPLVKEKMVLLFGGKVIKGEITEEEAERITTAEFISKCTGLFKGVTEDFEFTELEKFKNVLVLPKEMFYNSNITKVTFPSKLMKIDDRCFQKSSSIARTYGLGLKEMEEIVLPESCKELGYLCFSNMAAKTFTGNGVLKGNIPFNNVPNLLNINLPKLEELDAPNKIAAQFNNCKIINLNLPNLKKFKGNLILKSDSIEDVNIPKCKYVDSIYNYKIKDIENIYLPDIVNEISGFIKASQIYVKEINYINNSNYMPFNTKSLEVNFSQTSKKPLFVNLLTIKKGNCELINSTNNDYGYKIIYEDKEVESIYDLLIEPNFKDLYDYDSDLESKLYHSNFLLQITFINKGFIPDKNTIYPLKSENINNFSCFFGAKFNFIKNYTTNIENFSFGIMPLLRSVGFYSPGTNIRIGLYAFFNNPNLNFVLLDLNIPIILEEGAFAYNKKFLKILPLKDFDLYENYDKTYFLDNNLSPIYHKLKNLYNLPAKELLVCSKALKEKNLGLLGLYNLDYENLILKGRHWFFGLKNFKFLISINNIIGEVSYYITTHNVENRTKEFYNYDDDIIDFLYDNLDYGNCELNDFYYLIVNNSKLKEDKAMLFLLKYKLKEDDYTLNKIFLIPNKEINASFMDCSYIYENLDNLSFTENSITIPAKEDVEEKTIEDPAIPIVLEFPFAEKVGVTAFRGNKFPVHLKFFKKFEEIQWDTYEDNGFMYFGDPDPVTIGPLYDSPLTRVFFNGVEATEKQYAFLRGIGHDLYDKLK